MGVVGRAWGLSVRVAIAVVLMGIGMLFSFPFVYGLKVELGLTRNSGNTADYCGTNCLSDYGVCNSVSITTLFKTAMANGVTDEEAGGEYYYDKENNVFWSWDTAALIERKFTEIVAARGLGGVMAWSAGEDGYDWSHMLALQKGVAAMGAASC